MITIIGLPFTVITFGDNREFSFSSDGYERSMSTGSEPFSPLICLGTTKFVLLSVFTLKETICPKIYSKSRLKSTKSLLPSVDVRRSKTSLLKALPKMMTKNGIYSLPMKVISNAILIVYSLHGALIKIARVCHMRWRNYFGGTNPISSLQRRRS